MSESLVGKLGGDGAGHVSSSDPLFLRKGCNVEVTSDEEGFKGAWYVATVLEPPSSAPLTRLSSSSSSSSKQSRAPKRSNTNNTSTSSTATTNNNKHNNQVVYVEYHTLFADEKGSTPLREYADISLVRPPPPASLYCANCELYDVVDALYRDGWWTGVITSVIEGSKYVVTFENPPEEITFTGSYLRPHFQWRDDQWIRPEKQRTAGLMFGAGKKVEVAFGKDDSLDVWFPATVIENFGNGTFLVEYEHSGKDKKPVVSKVTVDYLHIRPSPPLLRDKNFGMFEKVDVLYGFGWGSGVITKQLAGNRYTVFFKKKNKDLELGESKLRPHMEWRDGKWFSASQRVRGKHQLENLMVDSMDKKGELKDAEKNAKALAQGKW